MTVKELLIEDVFFKIYNSFGELIAESLNDELSKKIDLNKEIIKYWIDNESNLCIKF